MYMRTKTKPLFLFSILFIIIIMNSFLVYAETDTTTRPLSFSESWLRGTVIVLYGNQYGTGFWINPTHIATAAHVVSFNPNAVVTIIRGSIQTQGRVVALDRETDIAVIYVSNADRFNKHIFPIARSMPSPTSTIYVIGYPAELYQVLGSLEALSENPRVLESSLTWAANGLIELGGIVDAGNSGGPVLDYSGNVIGIVSFALRGEAGTLYFATSAGNLKQLLQQHNIAYIEGTSGIIPSSIDDPAVAGAIAGATASIALDIALIALGAGLGMSIIAARKRRSR